MTGLVTLAVEGISGYLQDKRNKAMANAMDALHKAQTDTYGQLQRYKDDLTLYGSYSLKSTTDVLNSLEGMYRHQSSISEIITNLPDILWPVLYQSVGGHSTYGTHLSIHAMTQTHKLDFLYDLLIERIQKLVKGIATLSKGYLPPKLFPPSFLKNITDRVAMELHNDHRSYRLAFNHDTAYYDMPLATFSLDSSANIIVTFPIFIVLLRHEPLFLFEIETVPVPIPDLDPQAHSYSEVQIQKPYFAASESAYIQLRDPELFHCKRVEGEYFCEETFMVKHTHYDTCESTLFYNKSADVITTNCQFAFFHNRTVSPSVLDGGQNLILANVHLEHNPACDPKRLPLIPSGSYVQTSCEILCNCTLQSQLAYLPSDLGACPNQVGPIHFEESHNFAFATIFKDILHLSSFVPVHPSPPSFHPPHIFPINLTLPHNMSQTLSSLQEAHTVFVQNVSSSSLPRLDLHQNLSNNFLHEDTFCQTI